MDLERAVAPVVEAAGLELVEVTFRREAGRRILRVTVDREGGVDLDSIAGVSELISRRLDVEGFEPGPYALEVSSPGVERPLRRPEDFARRVGEKVRVRSHRPVEGARNHTGTIAGTSDDAVRIVTEAGEREVAFDEVASARTVFEWGPKRAPKKRSGK
jgi:ribosome maturation factor RimP